LNFLCDEGVERHIVTALREAGNQVAYVAEIDPSISDAERLGKAERLLLDLDDEADSLLVHG